MNSTQEKQQPSKTPPRLTFRIATIDDLPAIQNCASICFRVAHLNLKVCTEDIEDYIEKAYNPTTLSKELTNSKCHWYVVVNEDILEDNNKRNVSPNNHIIAYTKLTWGDQQTMPEFVNNQHSLQLQRLYVLPGYQNLKLGSLLLQYAVGFGTAHQSQFTTMWLTTHYLNDGAVSFYNRAGFVKTGECYFQMKRTPNLNFVMQRPFARAML